MLQFELSKDVLSFILSFDQFSEWAHLIPFYLASFNSLFSFFYDNFIAIRYTWPTCKFRCQVQSLLFLNNTVILRIKNQQMLHLSHLKWQRFPTSSKRTWVCTGNSYQKAVVKQTTEKTSVIEKMLQNFFYLKLIFIISQSKISALQPATENSYILVGHVYQTLYVDDWLNCIHACHYDPRCTSYNYNKSAAVNGLCELNACELQDLCNEEKSLVYSPDFIFQRIRECSVSITFFKTWPCSKVKLSFNFIWFLNIT